MLYTNTAREFVKRAMKDDVMKHEFFRNMREKLEPFISISPSNLYEKVIDENEKGPKAYRNLI